MALPNYAPEGTVLFGSVPWDSSYSSVRLYGSLDEQYADIASRCTLRSDSYAYIGRSRRLKVSIEADRMYHVNYCMYRNASLADGWIYCFVSDVRYVNDHTTEVLIETDVFQTYLYNVDWQIPACFIERETVPSEDERYLLTNEPDFPLLYTVDGRDLETFRTMGYIVITCSKAVRNETIIDDILNPQGYYADPVDPGVYRGVPAGAKIYYAPIDTTSGVSEEIQALLYGLNAAGSIDSIVAILAVPNVWANEIAEMGVSGGGYIDSNSSQRGPASSNYTFAVPARGDTVDGYAPRNRKLLYYPYTFCRLTDYNGSASDLRYEFMDSDAIAINSTISPSCEALVYPVGYRGIANDMESGFVTKCGAVGSYASNGYMEWVARNIGSIYTGAVGIAVTAATGGASMVAANAALSGISEMGASLAKHFDYQGALAGSNAAYAAGQNRVGTAAGLAGAGLGQMVNASKIPQTVRGNAEPDVAYQGGMQQVAAERIVVKAEVAEQIDEFFDRWGYEVDRIEQVDITSRPVWNYVKTGGAAPRSMNAAAGASAPFTRGRGTPAEALDTIRSCFDRGVTFWHTTDGYGDFGQNNAL